jgi:nucleotide-binding universal stress UspA family protein
MNALAEYLPETQTPMFASVICAIEDPRNDADTVRQAAQVAGVGAAFDLVEASEGAETVLKRCAGHDLLALPAGPLARAVLPRAPIPVLVVRPAPGTSVPESVLIAVDETPEAHAAARIGARLAARDAAHVALVAPPQHDRSHQRALAEHIVTVERISSRRPLVLDEYRSPARSIVAAASNMEASLIVIGSRPGRPADSVSAAVADRAPCSVLVLRPEAPVSP